MKYPHGGKGKKMKFSWGHLGRDFWLFRSGQVISVIGDSCGGVALAWWILDVTGSPAKMASIIAPAMFVRIFLLPLFGPFGDKYSRKWIIIIGDVWRGLMTLGLAAMVFFKVFNLPAVIALYILNAAGSALFASAANSIVPQLVPKEKLQTAMQQEQAIMGGGGVIGGIAGGLLVTVLGIYGAFIADAASYFIAAYASYKIKTDTTPASSDNTGAHSIKSWLGDIKSGFRVVIKIPFELWLAVVAAFLNFCIAPMFIALPVLVKQVRNMPPWFLGALESSISVGSILGAVAVGWICRKIVTDKVVVFGVMISGLGVAILPWIPNPALPLCMMFTIGFGVMLANIPLNTQMTLAMPDEYRARTGSVTGFLSQLALPLGTAFAGAMITGVGLNFTMLICGVALIILSPALFLIPKFSELLRASPEQAGNYYLEHYPEAFKK